MIKLNGTELHFVYSQTYSLGPPLNTVITGAKADVNVEIAMRLCCIS